ncbi:zinc finger protein 569-like [Euwallacea fornicatus]|uniref:zinc finger protein 569-like n=1 Tax=Euwallacea fornicatus TaxID=995702 RepID=UPI00338D944F
METIKPAQTDEKQSFCRLCLSTSVVYYSLLKNNGKEMLFSLTGISVNETYSSSTVSCVKCWLNLELAYGIQQRFTTAEKKFQLLGLHCVESKAYLTHTNSDSIKDPLNIADISSFVKVEHSTESNSSPSKRLLDVDANHSDDDIDYDELIYIQTDEGKTQTNCFICGCNCENDQALYTHTSNHYNEKQPCDICHIHLPNIAQYQAHIEEQHPQDASKTYCCGICHLNFRYMPLYELHLATLHAETAKSNKRRRDDISHYLPSDWKCEECNKTFRSKRTYSSHVKGHSKKKCPVCGVMITVYNLSKHVSNHKANPAVCHLCGITAKNPDSLRGHIYYTHSQKILKCELCNSTFKKLYIYKMHIKKVHTGEKSFTCDTCGKGFFANYQLNNHIKRRHLKERKYICQYCKKGFSSRFSMRTHERQHTNEAPYVCEMCGDGFRQNVSLRAHRKSKHNIVESKKEECSLCGKMFRDDWALKSHIRAVHD